MELISGHTIWYCVFTNFAEIVKFIKNQKVFTRIITDFNFVSTYVTWEVFR